ncbi:molybdopterin molybdenumtransferase MoeA [Marmoricola endophyticus]|uniref:Molybdopterin molybdenumtransferase n=1 Tax=Marmoricola endophyticus TaxID=2040280 RepID=A0A917BPS3_9ACTN|nr:gephyrin-like molybdotransferase Glp [Marmoricola endophyticus]GGF52296.1 molybdopterin molybdenumtransferase MoeA [Marmoricola endophyticus]
MPVSPGLTSVDDQLRSILDALEPLPAYEQPLLEAMGLPLAEDVVATSALPAFDNSSMDGYAVHHADVVTASDDRPVHLPVVGEIAAGRAGAKPVALQPGTCVRIMTGAPVPPGCDAVVPVEWTDEGTVEVRITQAPDEGQHVRRRGEDVSPGDVILEAGQILGPRQIGLLASMGRPAVKAHPRPRVVVISTGDELREPGRPLDGDAIHDGNSFMLAAAARSLGAIAYRVGIVSDTGDDFEEVLSDQLVRADVVVTSGGVSKGAYDVVKEVLTRSGGVQFTEVGMQPGKPQGFGFVGEERVPIFTLPGNPVSSYVSFEVFVVPALRKLMGRRRLQRPLMKATTTEAIGSMLGKRQFVRARYDVTRTGATVTPVGGHGSHLIGDLAVANALVVLNEDQSGVDAGTPVPVLVLDRDF